jgi:hypothetical protein
VLSETYIAFNLVDSCDNRSRRPRDSKLVNTRYSEIMPDFRKLLISVIYISGVIIEGKIGRGKIKYA